MQNIDVIAFGTTSTGDGVHSDTAGMIYLNTPVKNLLDNNTTYTVEVTGGQYVDFNNTGKWGSVVDNNGTLHAYMTGKQIKNGDFRVSILTEIAYQDIKFELASMALSTFTDADVYTILSQRAQKLLNENGDLTGDGMIDNEDLIRWNPDKDKAKLVFDYDEIIQPILFKLTQEGSKLYNIHFDYDTGEIIFEIQP